MGTLNFSCNYFYLYLLVFHQRKPKTKKRFLFPLEYRYIQARSNRRLKQIKELVLNKIYSLLTCLTFIGVIYYHTFRFFATAVRTVANAFRIRVFTGITMAITFTIFTFIHFQSPQFRKRICPNLRFSTWQYLQQSNHVFVFSNHMVFRLLP